MVQKSIYIATPCYGGMLTDAYLMSMLKTQQLCIEKHIPLHIQILSNESLVTRARNILLSYFYQNSSFSHLLFIDADIGWNPETVVRLFEFDQDVVSAVYPKKSVNWNKVQNHVLQKGHIDDLAAASCDYAINFKDQKNIKVNNGFVEALDGPTGFMMIKHEVIEKMIKAYPETQYNSDQFINDQMQTSTMYALFDCMIDPETKRYLSEDYTFCRRWQKIGGKIYLDLISPLNHVGTFSFQGNIASTLRVKPSK